MISDPLQHHIHVLLSGMAGDPISSIRFTPVGGGSINETYQLVTGEGQSFFCKLNFNAKFPGLFAKEKEGLQQLCSHQVIRTPEVIAWSELENRQVLVLEWIEQGLKTGQFWKAFGERLAALHRIQANSFGLDTDNYMGALPQSNKPDTDWCRFFIEQRLEPQVRMAVDSRHLEKEHLGQFENLYKQLPSIFSPEPPSLLHGDLWSGNFLCDASQNPVLIDPAVYYGHRSMDLGMTTLFGGFDPLFYESYQEHYPLPENYREQWEVCNIYPLLIHLNLFGKSYLGDILEAIKRY